MDTGTEAIETDDKGFIIPAQTYSYGAGLSDIWVIKIDSVGKYSGIKPLEQKELTLVMTFVKLTTVVM